MKLEKYNESLSNFKEAERFLLEEIQQIGTHPTLCRLLTVTLNNLACFYRKKGHIRSALRYFVQVLSIEKFYLKETYSMASTYLNVSTVLAELKKPEEALKFARRSMVLFTERALQEEEALESGSVNQSKSKDEQIALKSLLSATINVATMCYKTERFAEAISIANSGIEKTRKYIGPNHYLEFRLDEVRDLAQKKLQFQLSNPRRLPSSKNKIVSARGPGLPSKSFLNSYSQLGSSRRDKNTSEYDQYMRPQSAYCWEMSIGEKNAIKLNIDRVRGEVNLSNVLIQRNASTKSRSRRASRTMIQDHDHSRERNHSESAKPFEYPPENKTEPAVCGRLLPFKVRTSSFEYKPHAYQRSRSFRPSETNLKEDYPESKSSATQNIKNLFGDRSNERNARALDKIEKPMQIEPAGSVRKTSLESRDGGNANNKSSDPDKRRSQKSLIFDSSFESIGPRSKPLYPIDEQSGEEMRSRDVAIRDIQVEEVPHHSRRTSTFTARNYKT